MEVSATFLITIFCAFSASVAAFIALSRRSVSSVVQKHTADRIPSAAWADRVFLVLAIGYVLIFGALAVIRYFTFHTGYLGNSTAWDLGQYGQLVWNSLNGRLLEGTFVTDTATFLGKSFSPILLAFVPLYAVWQSPIVLLVVQTMGLGLGGFPIYWFARQRLGSALALVIALAYFLNPGLEYIGLTEFHEIALAVPLLAFATFFLLREHDKGFLVCLGLALLVKEEIGLIAIMFGVYVFLFGRRRRFGLALAALSLVWTILLLQYVIPFFRGPGYGGTFYYFGQGEIGGGGSRYGYLGHSVSEIATTILTRPGYVLGAVLIPEKITYVLHLLIPLAFLPIVGVEAFILALPTFAYSLLSSYGLQYEIRSYYFAPLLPFLFFAATLGMQRLQKWTASGRWARHQLAVRGSFASLLAVASICSYFFQAPGPFAAYFQPYRYVVNEHTLLGNELVATIPRDAFVVGQNEFLAQLSDHRLLYEIPIPDYRQVDYLFADTTLGWYQVHLGFWQHYLSTGYFQVITRQDGYLVARRRPPEHQTNIRFGDAMTLDGYTIVFSTTQPWGNTLSPILEWQATQPLTTRYSIAVRVLDAQGYTWAMEDREPEEGAAPTSQWQVGKPVGDQYTLHIPPTMPTGAYLIAVRVHVLGSAEILGAEKVIGTVHIEKNKGSFTASQLFIEQPLFVDMDEIRFLGFVPPRQTSHPGDVLPVGLYWRAREKPRGDYKVAVQLRDSSGHVAFEQVARPANNTYPTTQWNDGEVLLDWHDLSLPRDLATGKFTIYARLIDAADARVLGETQVSEISIIP